MKVTTTDQLLTEQEAGPQLRRTAQAMRDWRFRGGGPRYVKLGGRIYYRQSAITAFIEERELTPTDRRVSA
jgi:hypothetical protein